MVNIYCDGFCQRCDQQEKCKIFQERFDYQIKCLMKGRDPQDLNAIFEEIRDKLEKILKNQPIDFKKQDGAFKIKIKKIKEDNFLRKIRIFVNLVDKLLKKVLSSSLEEKKQVAAALLQEDLENLLHYCHLIELKTYESFWEKQKSAQEKNAALSYFSLLVCRSAINNFLDGLGEICSIECLFLLEKIDELRNELLKKFPTLNDYKDKIIFNTDISSYYTNSG